VRIASVLLFAAMFAACTTAPYTGRRQLSLVSASQLNSLGAQAFNQTLSSQPQVQDKEIVAYVDCVVKPLIERAKSRFPDAPKEWRLAVFAVREPNAFALPGGNIGVNLGMLTMAKNDAQLAAVLGHEIGHVLAGHSGERMSQQMVTQGGLSLTQGFLLGGMSPMAQQGVMSALGLGAQVGVLLPFSRAQESEADIIGLHLMAESGFDPSQAVELWRNMAVASAGREPPALLATHPATQDRIDNLAANVPKVEEDYKIAKSRMPAAESRCQRPSDERIAAAIKASPSQ
jgi:predicted Zn-dependent protease